MTAKPTRNDPNDLSNADSSSFRNEKLESLRRLAYGASHEINNPLANIASRAQALLAQESDPQRQHELATIYAQAMRGHEMIADLMLFARPPRPQMQSCELLEVVQGAAADFHEIASSQDTLLEIDVNSSPVSMVADPAQLCVLVGALIRNALEALKSGGKIAIRCGTNEGFATISVTDNGPGILQDDIPHVFDPFHSGREAGRGLGFGLTKCWTIAQAHQGDVTIDAEFASGTRVLVKIPISPSPSIVTE